MDFSTYYKFTDTNSKISIGFTEKYILIEEAVNELHV